MRIDNGELKDEAATTTEKALQVGRLPNELMLLDEDSISLADTGMRYIIAR